jgi:hypothetical protein
MRRPNQYGLPKWVSVLPAGVVWGARLSLLHAAVLARSPACVDLLLKVLLDGNQWETRL